MNLGSLGQDNIARFGEYESIYFEGKWYTNVEMEREGNRLGNALKSLGVQRGDRVAIQMPNSPVVITHTHLSLYLTATGCADFALRYRSISLEARSSMFDVRTHQVSETHQIVNGASRLALSLFVLPLSYSYGLATSLLGTLGAIRGIVMMKCPLIVQANLLLRDRLQERYHYQRRRKCLTERGRGGTAGNPANSRRRGDRHTRQHLRRRDQSLLRTEEG